MLANKHMKQFLVAIVVGVIFIIVASFAISPRWLRERLSRNWPVAPATVEGTEVFTVQGRTGRMFRCTLQYSYRVDGQSFGGRDTQDFDDNESASDYAESRKGVVVQVRFNPRKPKNSVLI